MNFKPSSYIILFYFILFISAFFFFKLLPQNTDICQQVMLKNVYNISKKKNKSVNFKPPSYFIYLFIYFCYFFPLIKSFPFVKAFNNVTKECHKLFK